MAKKNNKRQSDHHGGDPATATSPSSHPHLDVEGQGTANHSAKNSSDDDFLDDTPIDERIADGELNEVIPYTLTHFRGSAFYPTMSADAFSLLLDIVRQCFIVREIALEICDGDVSEPDPAIGLALNVASSIEMGFSNLSIKPLALPEEAVIANTALGIADYVYDLQSSILYPSLIKLRNSLIDFKHQYPISISINLTGPQYDKV